MNRVIMDFLVKLAIDSLMDVADAILSAWLSLRRKKRNVARNEAKRLYSDGSESGSDDDRHLGDHEWPDDGCAGGCCSVEYDFQQMVDKSSKTKNRREH